MTAAPTTLILEPLAPKMNFAGRLKKRASIKRAYVSRRQSMHRERENQAKVVPSQNM